MKFIRLNKINNYITHFIIIFGLFRVVNKIVSRKKITLCINFEVDSKTTINENVFVYVYRYYKYIYSPEDDLSG